MNHARLAILLLLIMQASIVHAATLRVGPGEQIGRIAEAARLAKDGDIVEILPGEYRGDVAVWQQKHLTIRGLDAGPVLVADGKSAEGKALWVVRDGDFLIENIEFRGARVPDNNGAGIRFERGRLVVRDCRFIDNQNAILTANFGDAELVIENSLLAQAPRDRPLLQHLLYVGRIASVTITGSRFHNGYHGHLIKSRARRSDIRYNLIVDGPGGEASYEIDLPNGGIATLVGNIVGQSDKTQNPVVVSYGAEGNTWPENELTLVHNTLLSDRREGTWFLRVPLDKFGSPPRVRAWNNLTAGLGVFSLGASGDFRGNAPALPFMLNDPATLDFGLPEGSPLRLLATDIGEVDTTLVPTAEFTLPIGTRPLEAPARWIPGAVQRSR
jgi:hypothetical protein